MAIYCSLKCLCEEWRCGYSIGSCVCFLFSLSSLLIFALGFYPIRLRYFDQQAPPPPRSTSTSSASFLFDLLILISPFYSNHSSPFEWNLIKTPAYPTHSSLSSFSHHYRPVQPSSALQWIIVYYLCVLPTLIIIGQRNHLFFFFFLFSFLFSFLLLFFFNYSKFDRLFVACFVEWWIVIYCTVYWLDRQTCLNV